MRHHAKVINLFKLEKKKEKEKNPWKINVLIIRFHSYTISITFQQNSTFFTRASGVFTHIASSNCFHFYMYSWAQVCKSSFPKSEWELQHRNSVSSLFPPQEHFDSSTLLTLTARTRGTDPQGALVGPEHLTQPYLMILLHARGRSSVVPTALHPHVRRRLWDNWAFPADDDVAADFTNLPLRICDNSLKKTTTTKVFWERETSAQCLLFFLCISFFSCSTIYCSSRKTASVDKHFIQLVYASLAVFTSNRSSFCSFNRYIIFYVLFLQYLQEHSTILE